MTPTHLQNAICNRINLRQVSERAIISPFNVSDASGFFSATCKIALGVSHSIESHCDQNQMCATQCVNNWWMLRMQWRKIEEKWKTFSDPLRTNQINLIWRICGGHLWPKLTQKQKYSPCHCMIIKERTSRDIIQNGKFGSGAGLARAVALYGLMLMVLI